MPPSASAGYVPWWLLALVAALFFFSALGLASFAVLTRPADLPAPTVTAIVITASPAPVLQPTPATARATATRPPDQPTDVPPPLLGVPPTIGGYVQVIGTGEAGFLNLRAEPSLNALVNYLALEREVLQVQAGPKESGGLIWWYLVAPATNDKHGWGAQNFLQVVQGP